ncbi:MAG: histidine phosphatase family protein [Acidobacteria bacterium]|nr:histidine phosphatase family protein [Acidobacteriota bacterium]
MHELYLIRHGQAGLRTDYDQLSDLGANQAGRLRKWFDAQGIAFDRVISGGLRRQQATAAALSSSVEVDAQWNEFDLDAVYESIAPQIASSDAAFRQEYETLQAETADPTHSVHRSWRQTDFKVVEAWLANRYQVECETWAQFEQRILRAFESLSVNGRVALVTSATPIGISTAALFNAPVQQVFELAGSLYNSSFTIFRRRGERWTLNGFNHTPHLEEQSLRTMR